MTRSCCARLQLQHLAINRRTGTSLAETQEIENLNLVPIPKASTAFDCGIFSTINLKVHTFKIFKINLEHVKPAVHYHINERLYGFMLDKRTRNGMYTLRRLGERCTAVICAIYCWFLDFWKALYKVQHNILAAFLSRFRYNRHKFAVGTYIFGTNGLKL